MLILQHKSKKHSFSNNGDMILTKIEFKGFRCFSDYCLDFRRGVNLLIGDNGSGKTSVIRGVVLALNAFFKGFSDENTSSAGITLDDFNHTVANESKSLTRPAEILFSTEGHSERVSIIRETKKANTSYKNAREFIWQNKELYNRVAEEDGNHRSTPLPLLAFFATDDIHSKEGKVKGKAFKDYYLPPSFGYYFCLKGGFLAKHWINRMLVLKEGGKGEKELEVVMNALKKALGEDGCGIIRDVDIRPKQGYVYFIFTDGREVRFEDLSDGYLRLVNTVMDLAFRCSVMNRPLYGIDACELTEGVVCIDEIDDHLHPSLQAKVIKALRQTFPRVQFIISTHAPMIMTSVEDNENNVVYRLDYQEGNYLAEAVSTYGLDASSIIQFYLHQADKDIDVQRQLDELFKLVDEEKIEEAKAMLSILEDRFSDRLPEITRARTLMSFYEV